jgi:hypothetical protein
LNCIHAIIWCTLFCFELKFYAAIWCEANCFALALCERKANLIRIKYRHMRNGKFELYASYPWLAIHCNYYFWVKLVKMEFFTKNIHVQTAYHQIVYEICVPPICSVLNNYVGQGWLKMQRKCQYRIILYIQPRFRFLKILLHAYCKFHKHDVIVDLCVSLIKITSWY